MRKVSSHLKEGKIMKSTKLLAGFGIIFISALVVGIYLFTSSRFTFVNATRPPFLSAKDSVTSQEKRSVIEVVLAYCETAKKEDYIAIRNYIAETPVHYWQYRLHESKVPLRERQSISGTAESTSSDNSDLSKMNYQAVAETTMFRGLILPVAEIQDPLLLENVSRVRVIFATKPGLPSPVEFDFFLVKRDGTWKIFKMSLAVEEDRYPT